VTVFDAIVLGLVQGLTEFLPVSSSGHLVIVPELLGIEKPPLAFDVLLHLATLVAVIGYFVREVAKMVLSFVSPARLDPGEVKPWRRLALWVVIGSVPAAALGLLLHDFFESLFSSTLSVGIFLLVTSALLFSGDAIAERGGPSPRDLSCLKASDALIVGLFQALALAPGISRAGSTIAGGIFLGLTREQAARFSFLLAIPAILGAGVVSLDGLSEGFRGNAAAYITGSLVAAGSGVFAVHFMLRFLREHRLRVFGIYTLIVGLLIILLTVL
jgi:undecaprenyl-diphosphatase